MLYSWAIDHGHVDCSNPCASVKKPSAQGKSSFYTEAEVARMLAEAANGWPDLHPIIACAFYTGARKGELASLRVGDCQLDGGTILISRSWKHNARKSGEPVTIQAHPHLVAILRPLVADRAADDLVFPEAGGGMRDKFDLWGLDEVLTKAEVKQPARPWHSFRHAHGTALAASGAGLAEIQEALGQSSLEMARRYTRIAADKVRERVHALPTIGPVVPSNVVPIGSARKAKGHRRDTKPNAKQVS